MPSAHSTHPLRRLLGHIRRSAAVRNATGLIAMQGRRAQQRIKRRYIRGAWRTTRHYLGSGPDRGEILAVTRPRGIIRVPGPTFVSTFPRPAIGGPLEVHYPARTVARLSAPLVAGPTGAVIGRDRFLIWDLSYEWPGEPHLHSVYLLNRVQPVTLPGTTVTLAAMGADSNYFHFLCNSVARLAYVLPMLDKIRPDRYLISGAVTTFARDTFALFGIRGSQLVGTDVHPVVRPESLVAPSLIEHPFIVPSHVCQFLRSRILPHLPMRTGMRRILVDRSDARTRRIANLPELAGTLESFGIEIVQLTGTSLIEQATLFRDAELVIANHGAALSNLMFCDRHTRVLQLLAPGMMEREYRTLSRHRGLIHDYLVGDFAGPADDKLPLKDRDLVIDPALLRHVLTREGWARGTRSRA